MRIYYLSIARTTVRRIVCQHIIFGRIYFNANDKFVVSAERDDSRCDAFQRKLFPLLKLTIADSGRWIRNRKFDSIHRRPLVNICLVYYCWKNSEMKFGVDGKPWSTIRCECRRMGESQIYEQIEQTRLECEAETLQSGLYGSSFKHSNERSSRNLTVARKNYWKWLYGTGLSFAWLFKTSIINETVIAHMSEICSVHCIYWEPLFIRNARDAASSIGRILFHREWMHTRSTACTTIISRYLLAGWIFMCLKDP